MRETLVRRREVLAEVCVRLDTEAVLFSPALIGAGTAFYHKVVAAGHEGIMAKLLNSAYRPGKRSVTWKKIKPLTGGLIAGRRHFLSFSAFGGGAASNLIMAFASL